MFWGRAANGTIIVSDSAMTVAAMTGAEIDRDRVALALAGDVPVLVAESTPFWTGVKAVRPGDQLIIAPHREPQTRTWWHPPVADQPLSAAATTLRGVLQARLADATHETTRISADLSGGLDSTSIVYALSTLGRAPSTFRADSTNEHNDDHVWAHRAARELGLDHHDLGLLSTQAGAFESVDVLGSGLDSPALWRGSIGYLRALLDALGPDAGVHTTGLGGDELFAFSPVMLWSLAQSTSPRHPSIRRFRDLHRWPRLATARAVRSQESFTATLARAFDISLGRTAEGPGIALAWMPPVSWPRWMTTEAKDRSRHLVQRTLEHGMGPRDQDRSRHHTLESLHFQGTVLRQISQAFPWRARWFAPFLDTRVVEAAMALDVRERFGADTVKPLLAMATEPFMPRDFFTRNGKGEYSDDLYVAFEHGRDRLQEFFDDSVLARWGLIDLPALRGVIASPAASGDGLGELERAVAVEHWLRAHVSSPALSRSEGVSS